jgi:hypothetical protein
VLFHYIKFILLDLNLNLNLTSKIKKIGLHPTAKPINPSLSLFILFYFCYIFMYLECFTPWRSETFEE